jgi:hypothetical protein
MLIGHVYDENEQVDSGDAARTCMPSSMCRTSMGICPRETASMTIAAAMLWASTGTPEADRSDRSIATATARWPCGLHEGAQWDTAYRKGIVTAHVLSTSFDAAFMIINKDSA